MPAAHAPKGGITIRGKEYRGGEFIPASIVASASPEERAELEKKTQTEPGVEDFTAPIREKFGTEHFANHPNYAQHHASAEAGTREHVVPDFDPEELRKLAGESYAEMVRLHGPSAIKDGGKLNSDALLQMAYQHAQETLRGRYKSKKFTDNYFTPETAEERAGAFWDAVDENLDLEHLDDDTRQAIAEDVAQWASTEGGTGADLAANYMAQINNYGTESFSDNSEKLAVPDILRRAAALKAEPASQFDGDVNGYAIVDLAGGGAVHDLSGLDPNAVKAVGPVIDMAGRVGALLSPRFVLINSEHNMDSAGIVTELGEGNVEVPLEVRELSDNDGLGTLFDALQTPPTVGEHEVPESAKNTGSTSGGTVKVEKTWKPSRVMVAKRINRDWYVVRRSEADPAAQEEGRYAIVHRTKLPIQVRLPDVYWKKLGSDIAADDVDDDAVEETLNREQKATAEGTKEKRTLGEQQQRFKVAQSTLAKLREQYHLSQGQSKRIDAQNDLAETVYSDWQDATTFDPDEGGDDHNARLQNLDEALAALRDHTDEAPDSGELDLPELPRPGEESSRDILTDQYADVLDTFEDEAQATKETIDDSNAAFAKHLEGYRQKWQDVYENAQDVLKHGSGTDNEEVKANIRAAAKVMQTARRMITKLTPKKPQAAPKAVDLSQLVVR